jgi:hypothetical protein
MARGWPLWTNDGTHLATVGSPMPSFRVFAVFLLDFSILDVLVTVYDRASGVYLIFHKNTVAHRPEQQRPFWKADVGTLRLPRREKRIS